MVDRTLFVWGLEDVYVGAAGMSYSPLFGTNEWQGQGSPLYLLHSLI